MVSDTSLILSTVKEELWFFELFGNILHWFLSEIISETLKALITTFLKLFEEKHIIFSNLSMLRQSNIRKVALKNMTECHKNTQLIMSQHS